MCSVEATSAVIELPVALAKVMHENISTWILVPIQKEFNNTTKLITRNLVACESGALLPAFFL